MLPKPSEHQQAQKNSILHDCWFLVTIQLGGPFLLFIGMVLWEKTGAIIWPVSALFLCFLFSLKGVYIILIKQPKCPNCKKLFFSKGENTLNIGFSLYTHKCTNCGYKLKKGE